MSAEVVSITASAAWRRGVKLAIELLEQLEDPDKALDASLQDLPDDEDGPQTAVDRPFDHLLLRCMHRARDAGELAERAFAAVLSDVLTSHSAELESLEALALDPATVRRYAPPASSAECSRASPKPVPGSAS